MRLRTVPTLALTTLALAGPAGCFSRTTQQETTVTLSDDPPEGWGDSGDSGSDGDSGDSGSEGDSGDSGGAPDADGDGYDADEDCDDGDAGVHPGASDATCDGEDQDCDGVPDDAFDGDDYERNDADGGTELGDLTDDSARVTAYLTPEADEDAFLFYVEDGNWDWFGITIDVQVPSGVDAAVELWWYPDGGNGWERVDSADDGAVGRDELIDYGGSGGSDDSGWYGLVLIAGSGSSCEDPYVAAIEA